MQKRCLSCAATFSLSGSGKSQKYCAECRKRGVGKGWGFTRSNALKTKAAWNDFSEGIPPSETSLLTTPDGDKVRVWSSARTNRRGEGVYWQVNVEELKRLGEKRCGFSEPRKAPAYIIAIEGNSHIPLTRLTPEPRASEPGDCDENTWPNPWGYKCRVYIEAEKELQELGCGWRDVIIELDGKKVHVHHNGRMATMKRDAFKEFLAGNKRFRKRLKPKRPDLKLIQGGKVDPAREQAA
jgi:hypothetical protein